MDYKQMLEKFKELELTLVAQDERIKILEESFWLKFPEPPKFMPGTLPTWPPGFWSGTHTDGTQGAKGAD